MFSKQRDMHDFLWERKVSAVVNDKSLLCNKFLKTNDVIITAEVTILFMS